MKALTIDTAVNKFFIAAKNDNSIISTSFDIGMKQSETLLPTIEELLQKVHLTPSELDYTALCKGPGSFTGLRLAFSALKAFQLSFGTPLYALPTLQVYAHPYKNLTLPVASVIDAKKNKFYFSLFLKGNEIIKTGDYTLEEISSLTLSKEISSLVKSEPNVATDILCVGPDACAFSSKMNALLTTGEQNAKYTFTPVQFAHQTTDSLFALAEECIQNNVAPLPDYEGPLYIRLSEAEEKLNLS